MVKRQTNESNFEYKLRLCKMKINKEIDLDWSEIAQLLETSVSADHLRKTAYGMVECEKYFNSNYTKTSLDDEIGTRILHLSDLHYPYNLNLEFLGKWENKVDVLVLNGDIQDCQSISKYPKKYRIPFVDEMVGCRQMIIDIIELVKPKKVFINFGNHEERLIRYLTDKVHDDILELMPQTPLDLIVDNGFYKYDHKNHAKVYYEPLIEVFNGDVEVIYTNNWWCKVGKTIFTHPKAFKSGILGTVEKSWTYYLQLGEQFDTIVMSHTHKLGFAKYGNRYLYESGCLCKPQGYANDGRMTLPQSNGYLYLVQDNDGNIIYEKTKLISV